MQKRPIGRATTELQPADIVPNGGSGSAWAAPVLAGPSLWSPAGWAALLCLAVAVAGVWLWGVAGRVSGHAVLLRRLGGVPG